MQRQLELDVYGLKDRPIDIYYEVFSFKYPENISLKIYDVQKPIILYQSMEDIDCYISTIDYGKSLEKGAKIDIDESSTYCAPMLDPDSILYRVDNYYFSSDIDVRFRRISKYYVEKTCKKI